MNKTKMQTMFIGTMQLSELKKDNTQHIINGQQRITTFLILLKVLKSKYQHIRSLQNISLDCDVLRSRQQKHTAVRWR